MDPIIATLIYHDILNYPLTAWEVHRLLLKPEVSSYKFQVPSYTDTFEELERLKAEGKIGEKNGFYFLKGRENLYEERIERTKISEEKWHEVLWVLKLFRAVPFVRSAFLSGSVAMGNATKGSDVDIMVVAEKGRIWTTRFFLTLLVLLCGKLRAARISKKTSGKICLNHYVTTASLELKARGLYNAATYVRLLSLFNPDVLKAFYGANTWIFEYFPNASREEVLNKKTIPENRMLHRIQKSFEGVFGGSFGAMIEKMLSSLQKVFIRGNPLTQNLAGRIAVGDSELAFHPRSPENEILDTFTRKMI